MDAATPPGVDAAHDGLSASLMLAIIRNSLAKIRPNPGCAARPYSFLLSGGGDYPILMMGAATHGSGA